MESGEQIEGTNLRALVPDNDLDADRINLVFAPWGWDSQAEFVDFVAGALSWTGEAYLYDRDGRLTSEPGVASGAALGLFGIEPWRSSRDRFNVWYTDREPETPVEWLNTTNQPFSLPDLAIVTVAIGADRFNPELTSVSGLDVGFVGPGKPDRPAAGSPFTSSVVVIDPSFRAAGLIDVPHELGHGLFNLADEYVGDVYGFDGRTDLSSWPSCAEDLDEAAEWWTDLTGDVDPMVAIWVDELDQAGFPLLEPESWADRVRVDVVDGGCYAVAGSARATSDSLMNTGVPVLGSVNRRWAEQILDLWEGQSRS